MTETSQLLSRTLLNGSTTTGTYHYGSISTSHRSAAAESLHPKFVHRKRDLVVVSVLAVLLTVTISTTLILGIANIRSKESHRKVTEFTQLAATLEVDDIRRSSSVGNYPTGAVSSNSPVCSAVAVDILRQNGSAVDAAVAATFCLSVCDVHHSGLGGGFFMTVYNRKERRAEVIDARETAPAQANSTMFGSEEASSREGGLAVAVPGLVRGLWEAHRRHGKLDWPTLLQPSISLAEQGISVEQHLADSMGKNRAKIIKEPSLSWLVDPTTGDVYRKGAIMKQPVLAQTLRTLADEGADSFYEGRIGQMLVKDIQGHGGIVTLDDLRNYSVYIRDPVSVDYASKDLRLLSTPLPASGSLLAFIFNVLDGYNLSRADLGTAERTALTLQRLTEALKFAYALRTKLGDPVYVNVTQVVSDLESQQFAATIRRKISENVTHDPEYYGADEASRADAGTSQLSIVAANGDAVSVTSTINQLFGALIGSPSTGIVLNDEMDDFSSPNRTNAFHMPPSPSNYVEPRKRSMSSMCPTIVTDAANGDVVLVVGGTGGSMITSSVAQVILRRLWLGQELAAATDTPRLHHQLFPNTLEIEATLSPVVVHRLSSNGHRVVLTPQLATSVSSVEGGRLLRAVADGRVGAGQTGY